MDYNGKPHSMDGFLDDVKGFVGDVTGIVKQVQGVTNPGTPGATIVQPVPQPTLTLAPSAFQQQAGLLSANTKKYLEYGAIAAGGILLLVVLMKAVRR